MPDNTRQKRTIPQKYSVKQIRAFEKKAISFGISQRLLIEFASTNLANEIKKIKFSGKKFLAVCGRGNNAADVLAASRKLISSEYAGEVVFLDEGFPLNSEACFQENVLKGLKVKIVKVNDKNIYILKRMLKKCDFVIDGIFGVGIKRDVSGFFKEAIGLINKAGKKIVACDLPSGLCPDSGQVLGAAIKANYTVTFIGPKKGFFLGKGKALCGKVIIVDIGFPVLPKAYGESILYE